MMAARILIADDQQIFRDSLKCFLTENGFDVVAEAADGLEALRLADETRPDVAVLDVTMPGLNGVDVACAITRDLPEIAVVLLTEQQEERYVIEGLRAGIKGYVLKNQAGSDLVQAIQEVTRGAVYLAPGISQVVVDGCLTDGAPPPEPLTLREREVLQLVAEGKSTKEIASILNMSVKTAETHRGRTMKKLDIHETAGLVRYAIRRGLVRP
ncbi:MAG: response regulator [Candidatus Polarisedimenticolia bacterium]